MKNVLEYKGYIGSVEFSEDILFGKVIGIDGLISFEGDNIKSLRQDFEEAVDSYLEMCKIDGVEPEKTYQGEFYIKINPELHKKLDGEERAKIISDTTNRLIDENLEALLELEK